MPTTGAGRIEAFLADRIAAGVFPGAGYAVGEGETILARGSVGRAVVTPVSIPAAPNTLYDLASLTTPLSGALLAVVLQQEGALRLDDPLAIHLPSWKPRDARAGVTLFDLLVHRAGLPAWAPMYAHAADRAGWIDWIAAVPLVRPPGEGVVYSDLGYILLGLALERAGGASIDRLFSERVARPLGRDDLIYRPPEALRRQTAATETGNARERHLAGAAGEGYNGWRTGLIWGEVHDGNAHALGGAAGNAGLFGAAEAVAALGREFLGAGRGLIGGEGRMLMARCATEGLQEHRSAGFQIASTRGSSAGPALSPDSFGHTGFTGTSIWIDPGSRRVYVLLTNRVHPRFRDADMNGARREFHALAAGL